MRGSFVHLFVLLCRVGALHAPGFSRRALCVQISVVAMPLGCQPMYADSGLGYTDNVGMKSYSTVQRAWEKSAGMSQREILLSARGAGPREPGAAPEGARTAVQRPGRFACLLFRVFAAGLADFRMTFSTHCGAYVAI